MQKRERFDSLHEALLATLEGWQAGIWTAMPAIIQSFNHTAMTVTAQVAIQARARAKDNTWSWITIPLLVDVPVCFPGGGGYTLTFPIVAGDEALIVLASRCIDAWWQAGGVQIQAELRMHDLSDGFAIVGVRSQPRVLTGGVDATHVQLRSDDGLNYVEMGSGGLVRIEADTIQIHARTHFQWDVNGFGYGVSYAGGNVWNSHTWQTPRITPPDTVNSPSSNINPPEDGP